LLEDGGRDGVQFGRLDFVRTREGLVQRDVRTRALFGLLHVLGDVLQLLPPVAGWHGGGGGEDLARSGDDEGVHPLLFREFAPQGCDERGGAEFLCEEVVENSDSPL